MDKIKNRIIPVPVNCTGETLQKMLDNAAWGDVMVLMGDINLTESITVRAGKDVTLKSDDGYRRSIFIDFPDKRHFTIKGSLAVKNLIIDGCRKAGGLVIEKDAFLILRDTVVKNCLAGDGGGIYVNGGTAAVTDCSVITDNKATGDGGGIYGYGNAMLSYAKINDNEGRNGGGVYFDSGTITIKSCIVSGNRATEDGGGLFVSERVLPIIKDRCMFVSNFAINGDGGGVYSGDICRAGMCGDIEFRCNRAVYAYKPPDDAECMYPDINFSNTTITGHPLNNYDIAYTDGDIIKATRNVLYRANGGIGGYTGPDVEPCEAVMIQEAEETGIHREGYTFLGWNTQKDGTGRRFMPNDCVVPEKTIILYAQWKWNEVPL